jgi:hypothetical protein
MHHVFYADTDNSESYVTETAGRPVTFSLW